MPFMCIATECGFSCNGRYWLMTLVRFTVQFHQVQYKLYTMVYIEIDETLKLILNMHHELKPITAIGIIILWYSV